MSPRNLPFLANSAEVSGTVTRFAIVDCKLDPTLKVAVLKVALDWVLSERTAERARLPGNAMASDLLQARQSRARRKRRGRRGIGRRSSVKSAGRRQQFRFHVEVEFELPIDGPLPALEVTIRRVEKNVLRSPTGDMMGYADTPDLDPDRGAFAPDVARWLQHGLVLQAAASTNRSTASRSR